MKTAKPFGLRLFALLAVFAMIVAACTTDGAVDTTAADGDGTATTAPPATGEGDGDGDGAAPEGAFRVGMIANITTDNWWASIDTQSQSQNQAYLTNMKTSLFGLSLPGFVYVPAMAATDEPVAAVQEGDIWVVEQPIRDDRTWSDGTPVTANDLAFYFDTVREFSLGSNHSSAFPPSVLSITAPDDFTVRAEFDSEPGLAVWQNGVGFAAFVPAHFWQEHVDAARAAAEEATAGVTEDDARQAVVDAALEDDDPDNDDLAVGDVTQEEIDAYITDAGANEGLTVLYAVESPQEPSVGAVVFDQWETGAFAATVANTDYPDTGTEHIYYSDGSFAITPQGGETRVFGGEGSGDVVAQYVEGPFVGEILWVEHGTKDAAYEKLAAGELDYVYDPTGITSGLRNELASNEDLEFAVNQTEGYRYMAFNLRKPPMSDVAFRQATATVINLEQVADTVLAGSVFPGYTNVHPDLSFWYNEDVPRAGWADGEPMGEGERMDQAIQILRDAGYTWETEPVVLRDDEGNFLDVTPGDGLIMPNGEAVPDLELLAPGPGYDPFRATFAIWIAQWMADLGIPIQAEPTDFNAIVAATFPPQTPETALQWDLMMLGWGGGDPSLPGTSLVAFFHSREDAVTGGGFNHPGFNDADFDAAADAFEAGTTVEEAQRWTFEMERILAEQLPYVVLFRTPIIEAFRADVTFPTSNIMGGHSGFPNAWPNGVEVGE